MSFVKQTNMEIKSIFRSKFLLIIGILVLLLSIAIPIFNVVSMNRQNSGYSPMPYSYAVAVHEGGYGESGEEPITIDGITINNENPFYWNVKSLSEESEYIDEAFFQHPEAINLVVDMIDMEQKYYLKFAQYITTHEDYRVNLAWDTKTLYNKFIYEKAGTTNKEVLIEALNYRYGVDPETFDSIYVNITPEERMEAIQKADDYINRLYQVVENDDFPEYIALSVEQQQNMIEDLEKQIETQEEIIIKHPEQEESLSQYIEDMKRQIKIIETSTIPVLQYRLDNNIIPGQDIWQNVALSSIEQANNEIQYAQIKTEEEFNKEQYLAMEYKSYARYKAAMQAKIDKANGQILVAQNSLDADKPDMSFVWEGSRNQTVNFLYYSLFVAMFGVILGGWLMASEFQMGTIRLLMIRPKTRTKIMMSKFLAALIICIGVYIVGTVLNFITTGICYGFSDFAFPNYTASGEIGFLAYYLPKFLACIVPIIFGYCVAFMLSTVVKNIAVSISIPIVCLIGCFIAINAFGFGYGYGNGMQADWLAWTPIPYVMTYSFFSQYGPLQTMMEYGAPLNLGYGLGLLAVLSAVCMFVSVRVFKNRDITN